MMPIIDMVTIKDIFITTITAKNVQTCPKNGQNDKKQPTMVKHN